MQRKKSWWLWSWNVTRFRSIEYASASPANPVHIGSFLVCVNRRKVRFCERHPHRIKYNLQCAFGYEGTTVDQQQLTSFVGKRDFSPSLEKFSHHFVHAEFGSVLWARIMHPLSGFGRVIKVLKLNLLLDFSFLRAIQASDSGTSSKQ